MLSNNRIVNQNFYDEYKYFDEFLDNHFVKDDDYKKAMEGRSSALKNKFKSQ